MNWSIYNFQFLKPKQNTFFGYVRMGVASFDKLLQTLSKTTVNFSVLKFISAEKARLTAYYKRLVRTVKLRCNAYRYARLYIKIEKRLTAHLATYAVNRKCVWALKVFGVLAIFSTDKTVNLFFAFSHERLLFISKTGKALKNNLRKTRKLLF